MHQFGRPPVLNPKTYTSSSGEYTALVNPTNREGGGPAHYRVKRGNTVIWEGKRPFTLWEAGITDSGIVAGFSYSQGVEGWGGKKPGEYGELAFVIVAPDGTTRLRENVPRVGSRFLHASPTPLAAGLIVDEANDRFVVRLNDEDLNRSTESWRVYSLSTSKRQKTLSFLKKDASILFAEAITGTPLTLLHCWLFTGGDPWHTGARFTLIDLNGKTLWSRDLPTDYDLPKDDVARDALHDQIRRDGAILATNIPGQFTLRFVAQKQRVTFSVKKDAAGEWHVAEVGREPYLPPTPSVIAFTGPTVTLTPRTPLVLRSPATPTAHPIRDIRELVAAGPGRLAFLRNQKDLVVVTEQGAVVHTASLAHIPLPEGSNLSKLLWRGGAHFLVFVEHTGQKEEQRFSNAYKVDVATGTITRWLRLKCSTIQSATNFPTGDGFLVLGTISYRYSSNSALTAFDSAGKQRWELIVDGYRDSEAPRALLSPESATVLRDGTVAVLDQTLKTVHLYTQKGNYLKTIFLKKAWGREPNYPSDILATPDGGFLVHDFHGTPSLVWMSKAGKVLQEAIPHDREGQVIEFPMPTVAADGQLWVSDDHCLLQQSRKGKPTRLLGEPPDARRLRKIATLRIHPDGRILVADQRSRAAHLFDATGTWRTTYRPKAPTDQYTSMLSVGLRFGPHETYEVDQEWFDATGKRVPKPTGWVAPVRPERRPDGNWLYAYGNRSLGALTKDGSFGLLDGGFVCLYTPTGAPLRQFPLPTALGDYPELAYDGATVVLTNKQKLFCYKASGEPLWQAKLPFENATPFLTEDGKTLCLFDGERTVHRYAMLQ